MHITESVVLLRNKVGGFNKKKHQGQILVGTKGLQWHTAASETKLVGSQLESRRIKITVELEEKMQPGQNIVSNWYLKWQNQ